MNGRRLILLLLIIVIVEQIDAKGKGKKKANDDEEGLDIKNSSSVESQLFLQLFDGYNKELRPALDTTDATLVTIYPYIYALLDVDERSEWVRFIEWRRVVWRDEYLVWDPDEFDGIDIIFVPVDEIWKPDIMVFNTVDRAEEIYPLPMKLQVHYDGSVNWVLSEVLNVRCRFKVLWFPFDTQNCTLQYGTWAYTHSEINLNTVEPGFSTGFKHSNSEWSFIEFKGYSQTLNYTLPLVDRSFARQYDEVIYHLIFRRKPTYYVFVLIIPSFIITTISILGLFSPFNSGGERSEKVNLGLCTLLTMAVMLQLVADAVPRTKDGLPMLGNYMMYEFVLSSIGTCITVIIMFVHHRANSFGWHPPKWLLRFTFVKGKMSNLHKLVTKLDAKQQSILSSWMTKPLLSVEANHFEDESPAEDEESEKQNELLNSVKACLRAIESIRAIMQSNDESDADTTTWNRIFDKIDLYLMLVFLVGNIVMTMAIFWVVVAGDTEMLI